jgi:hypothetical protein
MDFKDYQSQLQTLIPYHNDPDFNDIIDKIFFGESSSDKFLIKMELKRLIAPCSRIIDLRDKVTEATEQYTHLGITHYLTKSANVQLENAVKLYNGYSVGAYELVIDHVQKMKQAQLEQKAEAKSLKKDANITTNIPLNNHRQQNATRMFFVSKIKVIVDETTELDAVTSNISASGLKIKLAEKNNYINCQIIHICFTDLSDEYKDKAITGRHIAYKIVKQEEDKTGFNLYLSLKNEDPDFINFMKKFISSNQHKHKLDMLYYFMIAREKALKNTTLMAMDTLPIYLNENHDDPVLFMLRNDINKEIINDWRINDFNQIPTLLSKSELNKLLPVHSTRLETTVYCFTIEKEGKSFLFFATETQLASTGLKHLFIDYGQRKSNWHCYHLTLENYTYQTIQHYQLTDIRPKIFNDITHIATLTEIKTQEILCSNAHDDLDDPNLLNQFAQRKVSESFVPVYDLFPNELRKEERYHYASAIKLHFNDKTYTGSICDFSNSGLKIKLTTPKLIPRRSLITVDFVDLQKLSDKFNLLAVQYKVISSSSNTTYHLQIASKESYITMHQFFSLLVKKNPTHFKVIPLKSYKQPVTSRLHEVVEPALHAAFFYVSIQNNKPSISFSSIAKSSTALKQLFSFNCENEEENNHIIFSNKNLLERILIAPLKEKSLTDTVLDFECCIYVNARQDRNKKWTIESYLDEDFNSDKMKRQFIISSRSANQLHILHYRLSAITAPDLKAISSEIDTLSASAMHLTQRLEDELLNLKALVQVVDRTEQILKSFD